MLNSGKHKEYITEKIGLLKAEIYCLTKQGLYNQNLHCEYLIKNILNIVYDWDLINLNTVTHNYPSIDLGDFTTRVSVQVTSTKSSTKVSGTLKKFFKHNLNKQFDKLYIFILTQKQGSYTITEKQDSLMLFDENEHIMDFDTIINLLYSIGEEKLVRLNRLFEDEFGNTTNYLLDIDRITTMITEFTNQQIDVQKRSRKYIPGIFVEISEVKELARYFIIPKFYYRAYENISFHAIDNINKSLEDVCIEITSPNIELQPAITVDEITKYSQVIASSLVELKVEVDRKLEEYQEVSLGLHKLNPTPRKAWRHSWSGLRSSYFLDEAIQQFEAISKRILLITSIAGKGKTNFLCDLIENVIVKRGMHCLFFTGNDLNGIDLNNIGDYMIGRVFKTHYFATFKEFTSYFQKIFEMTGKYLFIVIDGLNEVNDLTTFPPKLCYFIETLLSYDFIKLILSCRSEFFTERFKCLSESSFSNEIYSFTDFNRHMTDFEKMQLYEGYLKHFKIDIQHISNKAYDQLSSDPLLLRIFCEANTSSDGIEIHNLMSLNKEHIFEKYFQYKIEQFTLESKTPIPLRKIDKPIKVVFDKIVQWMLDNNSFTNIEIESLTLSDVEEVMLSRMINEDILLRKDIDQSGLSEFCLNFTYDEFRDFLMARYLLSSFTDIKALSMKLADILVPTSPIYEGVQKFLFHISRRIQNHKLNKLLKTYAWYDELFIQEVFQLDDSFIDHDDLMRVERVIRSRSLASREFIVNLIRRPDERQTFNLNIILLLQILMSFNEEEYRHVFGRLFYYGTNEYYVRESNTVNATKLIRDLIDIFKEKPEMNNVLLNYLSLVIFMLDSDDYKLKDQSRMLLERCLDNYPEVVANLLMKYKSEVKVVSLKDRIYEVLTFERHKHSIAELLRSMK